MPFILWKYGHLLGADATPEVLVFSSALGLICGAILSIMDYTENRATEDNAPSTTVTRLLIGITPLCFWIPFLGPAIAFAAIYRTHWFELPDWMHFVLNTTFLLGMAITLVALLNLSMDLFGQF
jgi:hypothetical protein